ncbi:MAG: family 16 glycosylhydrolase [Fimbriimonas sp.]
MAVLFALAALAFTPAADWKLVWSDEFDMPGLPDSEKWGYEEGYIRNGEKQFYTKRRENARVEKGKLIIEAQKDGFQGKPITSASLTTQGKAEWTYGKFEVRAKLPAGRGTWPAAWMLGTNISKVAWPKCGEIDIMEYVGFEPNKVYSNVHTLAYNHSIGTGKGSSMDLDRPFASYHVYSCEWTLGQMQFFVDGRHMLTFKKERDDVAVWPFDAPQYLILNLAIGGGWGGQKGIDDAIFPARYEIDYVRVYQQ